MPVKHTLHRRCKVKTVNRHKQIGHRHLRELIYEQSVQRSPFWLSRCIREKEQRALKWLQQWCGRCIHPDRQRGRRFATIGARPAMPLVSRNT